MQFALPGDAGQIVAGKVWRRISVTTEREVLVIELGVRIVEVWPILLVRRGPRVLLVIPFILIGDAVIEQPVGDQPLLLALDPIPIGGANVATTSVLRLDQICRASDGSPEDRAEQVRQKRSRPALNSVNEPIAPSASPRR